MFSECDSYSRKQTQYHSKLSKLAALAVASLSLVLHSCPAFVGDLEFSWGKESDTRSCSNVKF